jgi:TP901 family phage tail tape measure protein
MASSLQLSADLRLNPNSIKQSANQVKQALGRITGQASEFQKSLDASTARVFAFGATTVVLNTVSQAFRKLAESTIEVQKRLVEINAIFQQSESVLQNFRESIFDVAQNTGQAFSTVADAAAELARQGLSAEETTKRLQAALILTRISGLGAEDSVKTLTAAINGFTSAALTANEVTDKIVAVDTAFAVSAQDLAQGLARAGSTAEDAGVSFNELLGLITAVEQRTARGGAVIGNAFKSIFTRLSRGTTIADLQSLGVEIDATQTGVQKLQALSNAIEGIGDPTVVSKIKELAGGVFQINVVSAALKDLTSETSVFRKAADEAATASGQAFKRNETLNKSLAAQINSLVAGLTDLAEKIGSLTFAPLLTNLISVASKITETLSSALGGENGSVVIKGLFKGIGAFISGPGLVIITSAFLKIVKLIGKFAIEGFRSITLIGSETEKIKGIEKGIVNLLSQDDALRKSIASKTLSQAQKEQAVIDAIKRENQLLTQQEALLRRLATLAASRGVTGFGSGSGFTGGNKKRFSQGYVPNFARNDFKLEEAEAKSLGASSSVKARMGKGKIGGKRFVMNNQETEIPNFGRNGDSAVIPRYSKGFVPNFVNKQPPPLPKSRYGTNNQWVSVNKAKNATDSALFTSDNDAPFYPFKAKGIKSTHDEIVGEGGLVIRNRYKEWEKAENSKRIETIDLNQIVGGSLPSILIPRKASSPTAILNSQKTDILKPINYEFPVKGISGKNTEALEAKFEKDFDPQRIEKLAKNRVLKFARQITDSLGLPKGEPKDIKKTAETDGFTGAIRSAAGAIFDASVTTALNVKSKDTSKDKGGNFDVRGKNPNLKALFGQSPTPSKGPFTGLGDFKFTPDTDSLRKKSLNELRGKYKSSYEELKLERNPDKKGKATVRVPKKTTKARKKGFASGYIPNFVGNGPLGEAIKS